jgi:cellulose synthase/poly-beta-1,6-N-acetylglucosamine synthase-like glycosyltransferase
MQALRWPLLFGAVLGLLIFSLCAGFIFRGAAAWLVGLIYISYDTLLLGFMVVSSYRAVRKQEEAQAAAVATCNPFPTGPRARLSVVISARNERLVLPRCLECVRAQTEPAEEVLILDDGSTDSTIADLDRDYALEFAPHPAGRLGHSARWPALQVLCKPNSGKADSLNLGWRQANGEIIVTLDADTDMEPGALQAIRDAFAADPALGIAGGVLTPICQRTPAAGFFQFFQTFEYARGFLWRLTWMQYDMLVLISGAFAAYRRSVLETAGGFDVTSWVEDYELTHRVYRDAYDRGEPVRVQTLSGAKSTTDAPASVRTFLNQRRRWFGGFIATHFQYHDMVANGRYGAVGRFMMPLKTLDLLLPIYALAAAVVLILILIVRHGLARIILIAAKLVFDLVMHAYAVSLYQRWLGIPFSRRLWLRSMGATLTEPFVFQIMRQLGAVFGWLAFLRGEIDWHPQRAE